jgi:hypothetical protein
MGQISLEQLEADFRRELDDAQAWYTELRERELSWIREGRDPEAEFDRLYSADPMLPGMDVDDPMSGDEKLGRFMIAGAIVFVIVIVAALVGAVLVLRRLWVRQHSVPEIAPGPSQADS